MIFWIIKVQEFAAFEKKSGLNQRKSSYVLESACMTCNNLKNKSLYEKNNTQPENNSNPGRPCTAKTKHYTHKLSCKKPRL